MSDTREDTGTDERLSRLAKSTEDVRPRADFTARVMGAVANENAAAQHPGQARSASLREPPWWSDVPFVARRLLPVAAIAAAVGIVWAVRTSADVDTAFADSFDSVELEW